jgi:uncharacterized membrane protein YcaP (DUF421 family)
MMQWVEIVLRCLGTFVVLYAFTRILGKKQISQLTFFEYILGITLGELAGFISTDLENHYLVGLTALCIWFLVPYSIELLTLKSLKLRQLLEGKPRVLIKEGKIMEDNLKKERLTADELMEQLRGKNVFRTADVEFAVMETNGDLSVLLKKDKQPLTPGDMGIKTVNEAEPQIVIIDGNIMDEGLADLGLSRGWLLAELEKIGVKLENVFLGQVDAYQQLYVDLYDDKIKVPYPQAKSLLMASLKKIQADLELFATSTRDAAAKAMYANNAQLMESIITRLSPMMRQ